MKNLLKLVICVVVILNAFAYADYYTVPQGLSNITIQVVSSDDLLTIFPGLTILESPALYVPYIPLAATDAFTGICATYDTGYLQSGCFMECVSIYTLPENFQWLLNGVTLCTYVDPSDLQLVIPEPTTVLLFVSGLFAIATRNKKHK